MTLTLRHASSVFFLLATVASAQEDATAIMRRIVAVQKPLPWFFTPFPQGIREVPYAYEYKLTRHTLNAKGEEVFPPRDKDGHYKQARSMHFEHIPLKSGWGWDTKCISQDGVACGKGEWDVPPERNPEKLRQARDTRRLQRVALWDEFLKAFRFETAGLSRIRFEPTGSYKHAKVRDSELFEIVKGELAFDTETYEIVYLEFELIRDAGNVIAKLYKGTIFSIDLTRSIDSHYLPAKWSLHIDKRLLTRKGFDETEFEYFNYRKFQTESSIAFEDPQ